jgi:molybdopterin-guanine dinucleotide biosynthesis protein A
VNAADGDTAVVILAGGMATRFPGKLEVVLDGEPLWLRAYRNACATGWPVYVAGSKKFSPALAGSSSAPLLVDRWPGGGPLRALASACAFIGHTRVLALAADEPRAGAGLIAALDRAWRAGDEAVVPRHGDRIEPLAALYLRTALVREATVLLATQNASMHALLERMRTRFATVSASYFSNVNTPEDLRRVGGIAR